MTLQSDLNTVTAKLNTDADQITALGVGGTAPVGTPTGSVSFTLPSGYTVTITEKGIVSISLGGVQIAYGNSGGTQLLDGAWFYKPFTSASYTPTLSAKSILVKSDGAIVYHTYTGALNAKVIYTYKITGDDIRVSAEVKNLGTSQIDIVGFCGPQFVFDNLTAALASGNYRTLSTHTIGPVCSYPSANVPFAGIYVTTTAASKPVNFCTWSEQSPDSQHMVIATGTYSFPGNSLTNFFFTPVYVGGSQIFQYAMRLSTSTDWKVLMQGYKDFTLSKISMNYVPDVRPIGQFSSINVSYIRPDNPYGYNDSNGTSLQRRFDLDCQPFVNWVTSNLNTGKFQGLILWQPQGIHPRGVMYRPDFNTFPAVTLSKIPVLPSGFNAVNQKAGLQARPGEYITSSSDWTKDRAQVISNDPDYIVDLLAKFSWATGLGFKMFYLDSFPIYYSSHLILKAIRQSLGNTIQTFSEFSSVLAASNSGFFAAVSYSNGVLKLPQYFDLIRWFWPNSNWIGQLSGNWPAGGSQQFVLDCFNRKLIPLLQDYMIAGNIDGVVTQLSTLVPQYINASNQWI